MQKSHFDKILGKYEKKVVWFDGKKIIEHL
jgi:hypothetical protein